MTKLVMEWIKREGGVSAMAERNAAKSRLIYDLIDSSDGFYRCPVRFDTISLPHPPSREPQVLHWMEELPRGSLCPTWYLMQ